MSLDGTLNLSNQMLVTGQVGHTNHPVSIPGLHKFEQKFAR